MTIHLAATKLQKDGSLFLNRITKVNSTEADSYGFFDKGKLYRISLQALKDFAKNNQAAMKAEAFGYRITLLKGGKE